jgi:hypothetical protein
MCVCVCVCVKSFYIVITNRFKYILHDDIKFYYYKTQNSVEMML